MTTREFHFSEGTSNKFWRITIDGVTQIVHYGRIGTSGQEQTKAFTSDADAKSASDKLIAEKVKKGYVEVGVNGSTATVAIPAAAPKPASTAKPQPTPEAAPPPDVAAPPVPPVDPLKIERSIDLSEEDYVRAGLSPRKPKKKPTLQRFNRSDAMARLDKAHGPYGYWQFDRCGINPSISAEEAEMWFYAVSYQNGTPDVQRAQHLAWLKAREWTGCVSLNEIALNYDRLGYSTPPQFTIVLYRLMGLGSLIDYIVTAALERKRGKPVENLVDGFADYILPYLDAEETELARTAVRKALETYPPGSEPDAMLMYMASLIGMSDELASIIEAWPDASGAPSYYVRHTRTREVVLSLGDRDKMVHHFRRLNYSIDNSELARTWLAVSEYSGLDLLLASVVGNYDKAHAETMARVFLRVHAPEAALPMLRIYHESKHAGRVAREWFDANPIHAAAGLIPVALSSDPYAAKAVDMLADLVRRGKRSSVEAHLDANHAPERIKTAILGDFDETVYEPLDTSTTPPAIASIMPADVKPRPGDPVPSELPSIIVQTEDGPRRLNDEQVVALLSVLLKATLDSPPPYATAIKATADARALDSFAWSLFERWIADGAPSKEKWMMLALGLLGGDGVALRLAPLIRKWPGESQHARAVTGLECLRAIGTDTALMQINGIANKVAFKGIKQRAAECMDDIAKARNMSRAELEDRIVPDCDLDERGSRLFDFGPRQFRFVLSPEMKAMVKDAAGKVSTDLPKPNAKDDANMAAAAVAEWKLLKKQVSEVAKIQAARLEQAMVTGRRWSTGEFDQLLVKHPLMTNLVRMLVWGAYDESGKLTSTFRVTEDQSLANSADEVYVIPDGASAGIVHPLQMSADDKSAWGEIWADYEIVPPFPQLGRAVYAIADEEGQATDLPRFGKVKIPAATLIFGLEKLGWLRAIPADAGHFWEHTKAFPSANVTAVIEYEPGAYPYGIQEVGPQVIERLFFAHGIHEPEMYSHFNKGLPWGTVDPVVVSEVLSDLTSIVEKAGKP